MNFAVNYLNEFKMLNVFRNMVHGSLLQYILTMYLRCLLEICDT